MKNSYIIGIDEVGRGSLAGPVVVTAVIIPKKTRIMNYELGIMKDSKKLSPLQREKWFKFFQNHSQIKYALAKVHPRRIEKINISRAANLAALRAYTRLISNLDLRSSNISAFLDGGLYLGNGKNRLPAKTVIRGDQKISAIKIASIIAKVSRDRLMTRLAKKYPAYSFEIHKGYGTRAHYAALKKFGPSEIHRSTFLKFYPVRGRSTGGPSRSLTRLTKIQV
ncbi:MAG: ribonuclease HII [Candidatus Liptonbacteria bacterium]|nr:ribonuclease HII [Candidatus Liptonbacteria bacterium]